MDDKNEFALNRRQQTLYLDRVDLYPPGSASTGPVVPVPDYRPRMDNRNLAAIPKWHPTPTYRDVPCLRIPSSETVIQTAAGRMTPPSSTDTIRFATGISIPDGTLIRVTTPNHPDAGTYAVAKGNPRDTPSRGRRRVNVQEVQASRISCPEGFPK